MSNVDDIKVAILALPESQFVLLRRWITDQDWAKRDRQLERDVNAGRLNFLLEEAQDSEPGETRSHSDL